MVKSDLQRITRGLALTIVWEFNDTDNNDDNNTQGNEQGGWSHVQQHLSWCRTRKLVMENGYLLPLFFHCFSKAE